MCNVLISTVCNVLISTVCNALISTVSNALINTVCSECTQSAPDSVPAPVPPPNPVVSHVQTPLSGSGSLCTNLSQAQAISVPTPNLGHAQFPSVPP